MKVLLEDFQDRRLNVVSFSRTESAALQSLAQTFNPSENLVMSASAALHGSADPMQATAM